MLTFCHIFPQKNNLIVYICDKAVMKRNLENNIFKKYLKIPEAFGQKKICQGFRSSNHGILLFNKHLESQSCCFTGRFSDVFSTDFNIPISQTP